MSDVQTWSATAANNNSAAPNGWPEGLAASGVNNSARENMAAIAKWRTDNNGSLVSGGSADAYTLTPNATWTAYAAGMTFMFEANQTNTTTTPTLNVSALGAKTITDQEGTALSIGAIVSGGIYGVVYDNGDGKFKIVSASTTGSGLSPHAYCRVDATGALQTGSFGVSSAVKNSDGYFTVTLSSGVNSTSKAVLLGTCHTVGPGVSHCAYLYSSTSVRFYTFITGSTPSGVNVPFSLLVYDTY